MNARRKQTTGRLGSPGWMLATVAACALAGSMSCHRGKTASESAADPKRPTGKLIVFHAGSLSVPLREVSELFTKLHPGVQVKAEAAGSVQCARKISDLKRECDVMVSSDRNVVTNLLMPDCAAFNISFARNEMAIAYTPQSRSADRITSQNWPEILLSGPVAGGRADPALDPCGYRTLMVFQLAERHYNRPGLAQRLTSHCSHIRPKETDLLALLEVGEIDYVFIYRSVARQHGLKIVELPREINLGDPEGEPLYRTATVSLAGGKPGESVALRGEPMVYSVTIPGAAPNRIAAEAYVAFLLSPAGRAVMEKYGQPCITPARAQGFDKLPESLKPLCERQTTVAGKGG